MNSRTEALVHLIMAIIIMLVISIAVYYIGVKFIGQDLVTQANAAKAAGVPDLPKWSKSYSYIVLAMGLIATFILFLWIALTHWILRSSGSTGQSKRWLWLFLGIILAVLCVSTEYIFMNFGVDIILNAGEKFMFAELSIPLLFFVCYCLVGYWGGSIFVTSDAYKYTPIFAGFFR